MPQDESSTSSGISVDQNGRLVNAALEVTGVGAQNNRVRIGDAEVLYQQ
jgi:hypothetical protein